MALLFGVCFFLYLLKLSAGSGFCKLEFQEMDLWFRAAILCNIVTCSHVNK